MLKFILFISLLLSSLCISFAGERDWWSYKVPRELFYNQDGSANFYVVDTIKTSPRIMLEYQANYYAIFGDKQFDKMNWKDILDNPDCYIMEVNLDGNLWPTINVEEVDSYFNLGNRWSTDKEYPHVLSKFKYSKKYNVIGFNTEPQFYLVVLIQGKLHNFLCYYGIFDEIGEPIKFRNPYAFYKTIVPVWDCPEERVQPPAQRQEVDTIRLDFNRFLDDKSTLKEVSQFL